jgi:hypothetical protein
MNRTDIICRFRDGFCLTFLLFQRRIFCSAYWEHILTDLRSQAKLATEGATLFNELFLRRVEEDRLKEDQTVEKITRNLERIKEQQTALNQSNHKSAALLLDSADHFEGFLFDERSSSCQCDV